MSSSVISAKRAAARRGPPASCAPAARRSGASSSPAFFTRSRTRPSELRGVEDHHQDHPAGHDATCGATLLALVELAGELLLPEELGDAARGGDVAGGERGERGGVEVLRPRPLAAMSWPFLSTTKTTLALASRVRRSQIAAICRNSSSYITRPGVHALALPRRRRVTVTLRHPPNIRESAGQINGGRARRGRRVGAGGRAPQSSRRPDRARASVTWSAYSRSPPMGTPWAMRRHLHARAA